MSIFLNTFDRSIEEVIPLERVVWLGFKSPANEEIIVILPTQTGIVFGEKGGALYVIPYVASTNVPANANTPVRAYIVLGLAILLTVSILFNLAFFVRWVILRKNPPKEHKGRR